MTDRKWLAIAVALCAPIVVTACGGDDNNNGGTGGAGGTTDASTTGDAAGTTGDASADTRADALTDGDAAAAMAFARIAHLSPDAPAIDICLRAVTVVGDGGAEAEAGDAGDAETGTDAANDAVADAETEEASEEVDASDAALDGATDAADGAASHDAGDAGDAGAAAFIGPLFNQAGSTTGVFYSQVTQYLTVKPGTYEVRVVAGTATSCSTALVNTTSIVQLTSGESLTLAALGLVSADAGQQPFEVRAYTDERTVTTGQAKVRFIHASPGTGAVDVGVGTAESFVPLFTDVSFGQTGTGATVDAAGYTETPPVTNQTFSVRATGQTTDALVVTGVSLPAGTIASTFAIGEVGSSTRPLKLLLCTDQNADAGSTGFLANCTTKP